jgi:ascorbate-specific PTS system EIIC-type component UlaA
MESQKEAVTEAYKILPILGALLLWTAFFLLGVIARRYEVVFQKWTGWKSLMLAPSGILVYIAVISAQAFAVTSSPDLQNALDILAYGALLLSSAACFWVVNRFHTVLHHIFKPGKEA